MGWPTGVPLSDEHRQKISETWKRKCANPRIKAAWRSSPVARRYWFRDHLKPSNRIHKGRPDA